MIELIKILINALLLLLLASCGVWIIRLHFDPELKSFDLKKLVTQADGSPDGEKIRMWVTYVLGAYAFVHLLIHTTASFITYAPLFLTISFGHLVANRMTTNTLAPKPPATP